MRFPTAVRLSRFFLQSLAPLGHRHIFVKRCPLFTRNFNLFMRNKIKTTSIYNLPSIELIRFSCSTNGLDLLSYERLADETLEVLCEHLETILDQNVDIVNDGDVSLSSGVLTLNLGKFGIYVINKQTPNRQIWLSSPISGPKRYDYSDGLWIYKHDGVEIRELLAQEFSDLFKKKIEFSDKN